MKAVSPNAHLPYLHAWPDRASSIRLGELEQEKGAAFLKELFHARESDLSVQSGHEVDGRLQRLYFEQRSWERTLGSNPFALGYPLYLSGEANQQAVLAPILLWEFKLSPAPKHNEGWRFKRMPEHRLRCNPYLLAYWEEQYGEDLTELVQAFTRSSDLNGQQLERLCGQIAERIGASIVPVSAEAPEEEQPTGNLIMYEGLLGLFPNAQPLLLSRPELPERKPVQLPHPCSPIVPGPYQATAARWLSERGMLWLEGQSGTGKTALGRHLMHNALDNGEACLVVSARMEALQEYEQSLEQAGLDRLSFLLRDSPADKILFRSLFIAAANDNSKGSSNRMQATYQQLCGKMGRLFDKLDKPYTASRRRLSSSHNWMETVGEYLASAEKEGKELLGTQLNASDFDFSEEEYDNLSSVIDLCYSLYKRTHTLHSALSKLSPSIFLRMEKQEAQDYVTEKTDALLDKGSRLQHWYINRQNAYADQLMVHFEQYYQRFARQLTALGDQIAEKSTAYGTAYREGGTMGLKVKSVFSNQAKEVLAAREDTLEAYDNLKTKFEHTPYFDFKFPAVDSGTRMGQIERTLEQFEAQLQRWRTNLRDTVQEDVSRLSRKSANPQLGFEQQVEELEDSLDRWVDNVNETGLYHLPFSNKMLTIPKRQRFLEDVMEQLETTRRSLPEFENFYDWQRNWLQLDEKARRLVKALLKIRPDDWQAAYRTWFLDNVLNREYEAVLPSEPRSLKELWESREALLPLMTTHTMDVWAQKRIRAFGEWRRRHGRMYKQLSKLDTATSVSTLQILREAGDAVRANCPALLMNADYAVECFHGQRQPFGLVVVEEAASLDKIVLQQLLALGKRVLYLSPRQLGKTTLPPTELAADGCTAFSLEHYYRHLPGHLQQAAQGVAEKRPATHFHFEQIDGRYDETTEANEEEALRIVSLLNQIERTPQRTFPSVGIVCMTKGQRDQLSALLLGIKQRRSAGVETIQQLERNGLEILHLDELGGQHFEVLIVSSTFGPTGLSREMPAHYHRQETPKYQQLILQAMSRGLKRVMVLNSLPQQWLDEALTTEEMKAEHLLPAYFAYLRACAQEHEMGKVRLSRMAKPYLAEAASYQQPMALLEAIRQYLLPYLSDTATAVDENAPLGEPATVVGQPARAAVLPDGFLGLTPHTGFFWEYEQQEKLRQRDWQLFSTWSPNWWRNAQLEARHLAAGLLQTGTLPPAVEEEE
jgi:hypothetical protein